MKEAGPYFLKRRPRPSRPHGTAQEQGGKREKASPRSSAIGGHGGTEGLVAKDSCSRAWEV